MHAAGSSGMDRNWAFGQRRGMPVEGEGEGALSGKDLTAPGFLALLSGYVVARRSK